MSQKVITDKDLVLQILIRCVAYISCTCDPFQMAERQYTLRVKQTSKLYSFSLHIVSPKPIHKHAHYLQSCAGHSSSVHVMYSSINLNQSAQ